MSNSYRPLTPEWLLHRSRFSVRSKQTVINIDKGGMSEIDFVETTFFFGVIGDATMVERRNWQQAGHTVTHKVVVRGTLPTVVDGDVLTLNDRNFYLKGVDNPGDLALWGVLWLEERPEI